MSLAIILSGNQREHESAFSLVLLIEYFKIAFESGSVRDQNAYLNKHMYNVRGVIKNYVDISRNLKTVQENIFISADDKLA